MRLQEIISKELRALGGALNTLETGSIRSTGPEYERGDGWSTLAFARHNQETGGVFTSIDLDTSAAQEVLEREGLLESVDLWQGDSRKVLREVVEEYHLRGDTLDVVLLDSDNDPDLILEEFELISPVMTIGSVLLVDDVDLKSTGVVKGHKIVPYLWERGYAPHILTREGNGFTTGVMRVTL